MERVPIRLMKDRRREMIPVDKIRVMNSRNRDEGQFALNVQSIDAVGQIKDIRVNDKFLAKDGFYELICGEATLEDLEDHLLVLAALVGQQARQWLNGRSLDLHEPRTLIRVADDAEDAVTLDLVCRKDVAHAARGNHWISHELQFRTDREMGEAVPGCWGVRW